MVDQLKKKNVEYTDINTKAFKLASPLPHNLSLLFAKRRWLIKEEQIRCKIQITAKKKVPPPRKE